MIGYAKKVQEPHHRPVGPGVFSCCHAIGPKRKTSPARPPRTGAAPTCRQSPAETRRAPQHAATPGDTPEVFFRPWRDFRCSLSPSPRDESRGYDLSLSGLPLVLTPNLRPQASPAVLRHPSSVLHTPCPPGWTGPARENSCLNVDLYETYRHRSASIYDRRAAARGGGCHWNHHSRSMWSCRQEASKTAGRSDRKERKGREKRQRMPPIFARPLFSLFAFFSAEELFGSVVPLSFLCLLSQ